MIDTSLPASSELELTPEHLAKALRHLSDTRDLLVESVTPLSAAQWNFRLTADSWSIAEIVEHLTLIERRVHVIIGNMDSAPEVASAGQQSELDELILQQVPVRVNGVKAPAPVCPEGRWTGGEALQCFLAAREPTIRLLAAPYLRGRVRLHPLFGPWDGYQWLLATGSHTQRHLGQISEIKADRLFPDAITFSY